jgi:hypothetical protein
VLLVGQSWADPGERFKVTVLSVDPANGTAQVSIAPDPPPVPNNCFGQSLTYATVAVECYSYSNGMVTYDATDAMYLQRLDPNPAVADPGVTSLPRTSVPFFEDTSFQTYQTLPKTATYQVCATNVSGSTCGPSITVPIDSTVTPASPPGNPSCGPGSYPYRPCIPYRPPGGTP